MLIPPIFNTVLFVGHFCSLFLSSNRMINGEKNTPDKNVKTEGRAPPSVISNAAAQMANARITPSRVILNPACFFSTRFRSPVNALIPPNSANYVDKDDKRRTSSKKDLPC